jgi:hypothetical protein
MLKGCLVMEVRSLSLSDLDDINRLHREVWWPERSSEGWRWLMNNPAAQEIQAPAGLVLAKEDGDVAGFLGIFVQRFWQGNQISHASSGFSIIVPPKVRGGSNLLIPAYLATPGMSAHYTLNCNALSSPLYRKFGMTPWPLETHDLKLSWIIRPLACAAARGLRELVARQPKAAQGLGERLLPRHSSVDARRLRDDIEVVTDLSDHGDYATYWQSLKAEGRFMADRSPAMLRWRLSDPDLTQPIVLLAARRDGRIVAHAMAMMAKYSSIEPATLEILDLDGLSEARDLIPGLVQSLIQLAAPMGAAKLRLQTLSQRLLEDLDDLGRRARREGGYGHCHFRMAPHFTGHETWQPTPFDGDYSICWRPMPVNQAQKRAA